MENEFYSAPVICPPCPRKLNPVSYQTVHINPGLVYKTPISVRVKLLSIFLQLMGPVLEKLLLRIVFHAWIMVIL